MTRNNINIKIHTSSNGFVVYVDDDGINRAEAIFNSRSKMLNWIEDYLEKHIPTPDFSIIRREELFLIDHSDQEPSR